MAADIARTPLPPYYAGIFTSLRTVGDRGYLRMAERMIDLASQQPGYLGVESVRGEDGLGIRFLLAKGRSHCCMESTC